MNEGGEFIGLHAGLTEKVLQAAFAVSNELGFGFFESVYRRSLLVALRQMGLEVEEEVAIPVRFRDVEVGVFYADLVVNQRIVLELKVGDAVTKEAETQLLHYLKSSSMELGLLLVFGQRVRYRRLILQNSRKHASL